jgi:hypothetical protein
MFHPCTRYHIKQKKTPVVYKTDKIDNLHGHEVLRTLVRQCELNPIELILVQVKGFVFSLSIILNMIILQPVSSSESSSQRSMIISSMTLLSIQFSLQYSFSIHEVLRTLVRQCELNPIELILVQVKGFVAKNNTTFRLKEKIQMMCGQKQKNMW